MDSILCMYINLQGHKFIESLLYQCLLPVYGGLAPHNRNGYESTDRKHKTDDSIIGNVVLPNRHQLFQVGCVVWAAWAISRANARLIIAFNFVAVQTYTTVI